MRPQLKAEFVFFFIATTLLICRWSHLEAKAAGATLLMELVIQIALLATVFVGLDHYFWVTAKLRMDMFVRTVGKERSTYVRLSGEDFLVAPGQELVIRQSETEPGRLEVFTGNLE